MLSAGMLTDFASATTVRRRGLDSTSPPPLRAATVSSLMMRVKILPRLASAAPFLCLMVCHLEWPDMVETPEIEGEKRPLILAHRRLIAAEARPTIRPFPPPERAMGEGRIRGHRLLSIGYRLDAAVTKTKGEGRPSLLFEHLGPFRPSPFVTCLQHVPAVEPPLSSHKPVPACAQATRREFTPRPLPFREAR